MEYYFKILVLPSLLTFAIVASGLMGFVSYQSHLSTETSYVVKNLQQGRPCTFCHHGSFSRSSLRVARLPCEARQPAN